LNFYLCRHCENSLSDFIEFVDTLITANGDSLAGDWRGDSLFRASFSKGNLQNAPKVVKSLLLHSLNSTCNDKVRVLSLQHF
jgi:hypothetical protein